MAAAKVDQRKGGPGEVESEDINWVSIHVRR
jgi:hypothetical protein